MTLSMRASGVSPGLGKMGGRMRMVTSVRRGKRLKNLSVPITAMGTMGQFASRARRAEPVLGKLVEWVLNMTQARYDAHRAGEPDPYDLPPPDDLGPVSDARGRVEPETSNERSIA